ncbi:MAG: hypothetical protein OEU26_05550 [Candidatus Tectomicrobia bacterium]|nr:hypothetical protein [Candidatus Tectomicrobia bacterium]
MTTDDTVLTHAHLATMQGSHATEGELQVVRRSIEHADRHRADANA